MQLDGVLHEVLNVIRRGKVELHNLVKLDLVAGERAAHEELGEVAKVVAAVEADPADVVEADEARRDQEGGELVRVDAVPLQQRKVDAGLLQRLDRRLVVHVLLKGKLEVELPGVWQRRLVARPPQVGRVGRGGAGRGLLAVLIEQGQADLYHLQQVHVGPETLVVVVALTSETTHRSRHDARKLGVLSGDHHVSTAAHFLPSRPSEERERGGDCAHHSNIRIPVHQVPQVRHLLVQVVLPDLPYPALLRDPCRMLCQAMSLLLCVLRVLDGRGMLGML